ncbi:protein fra10ac1 homolog [Plakobranchus ocellatus]|uniref:Protein fra10ac1 homolog n=1 Tax=Plakobranchus ocellatus TaxID=259542 RepID=A0AAV4BP82_9GAST|nr:protein fra10ac1 homolog [Plakobranchus ocellatus]
MVDKVDFSEVPKDRGYDSAFESDIEANQKRKSFSQLVSEKKQPEKVSNKRLLEDELIKEEGKVHRYHAVALDAYSRHKEYVNNYMLYYGGSKADFKRDTSRDKNDFDVVREHHQFLWEEEDDASLSWEKRLAKKYWDKLFKEYCIADLSRYKENKVGMRWRVEKEVVDGKGQFTCGNKKCQESEGLKSWEVNFGYMEHGEKKNALIKLRLCPDCSYKLNYHHKRKEIIPKKKGKSPEDSQSSSSKKKRKRNSAEYIPGSSNQSEPEDVSQGVVTERNESEEGIWKQPTQLVEEKSREDEFDDYFADMFL